MKVRGSGCCGRSGRKILKRSNMTLRRSFRCRMDDERYLLSHVLVPELLDFFVVWDSSADLDIVVLEESEDCFEVSAVASSR